MRELEIEAKAENLEQVLAFLRQELDALGCTRKAKMQIEIALEEMFVNVAHYAYANHDSAQSDKNIVTICIENTNDPLSAMVTLTDNGIPFDPLAKKDPDVTLSAAERQIGGLGIYMVKKSMDDVHYKYENGKNILTFRKDL